MEKILVVDDEQGLRDVLSIMLKRAGYAVTVASDGDEAIAQVQKEIFDLVITDLKMPRVGGLEVLKAVKAASPDTVVLMITAFASADSAVEAMKHGADDYLTKPFQVDEVQLIIRNAIERRRWPARQPHGIGGAHRAQADGDHHFLAGRTLAAQEPRRRYETAQSAAL